MFVMEGYQGKVELVVEEEDPSLGGGLAVISEVGGETSYPPIIR